MADLRTKYLGLELNSPLVVSANSLSQNIDNILAMEDQGAGAVVMFSLFEEQLKAESEKYSMGLPGTFGSKLDTSAYFPQTDQYAVDKGRYLELIRMATERTDMPIIASLNGTTPEGWIEYSRDIEFAGADGLEINIYFIPADMKMSPEEVEDRYLSIIRLVTSTVNIPVAVKLHPYFSSISNMAHKIHMAGADGLVLFNRFYQPDFDIDRLRMVGDLEYSHPAEIRLPLLWIAVLYGKLGVSLAATTGIHSYVELTKYLLAGADVGMCASALYRYGIPYLGKITQDLNEYMDRMGFGTVAAFRGAMSQIHIADPTAYERGNYIHILEDAKWQMISKNS